mmetsp:Transcript_24491/g.48661  ORF Transcript_24491/g.48661 Transcript_24491/m.48661 type:complete len:99 (-) Transcript_24491:51-347(-)
MDVDPRRPQAVKPYMKEQIDPDQLPPDFYALLALIFGVIGLMMRQKMYAWLSLFCCLGSIANLKSAEMDVKQIVCSVAFAVMGIFVNYFGKEQQSQKQ